MTTVTVHHTRLDLLRLGFFTARRSPALKWTLLALAVVVLGINLQQQKSHLDPITLLAIALTTAIFTGAAYILMLAPIPLLTLLRNGKGSPAAESQAYRLSEAGLIRESSSSESLLKWGGARSLHKGKAAIYVGVSTSSYFILPRHSFANDQEYQSFWEAMQKLAPDTSLEHTRER
jgi:YcxB-like protein